jgi:hypothetical protein
MSPENVDTILAPDEANLVETRSMAIGPDGL